MGIFPDELFACPQLRLGQGQESDTAKSNEGIFHAQEVRFSPPHVAVAESATILFTFSCQIRKDVRCRGENPKGCDVGVDNVRQVSRVRTDGE